jgi:hypothetical protein
MESVSRGTELDEIDSKTMLTIIGTGGESSTSATISGLSLSASSVWTGQLFPQHDKFQYQQQSRWSYGL